MDFTKTIIPLSLMASESMAHAIDSEPIRARGIIVKYNLKKCAQRGARAGYNAVENLLTDWTVT